MALFLSMMIYKHYYLGGSGESYAFAWSASGSATVMSLLLPFRPRTWLRSVDTQYGAWSAITLPCCASARQRCGTTGSASFDQTFV